MMATSVSYIIIQMPGLIFFNSSPEIQARRESGFALVTLLLCVSSFIAYLVYQRMISGDSEVEERLREDAMIDAINQVRNNEFSNWSWNFNLFIFTWLFLFYVTTQLFHSYSASLLLIEFTCLSFPNSSSSLFHSPTFPLSLSLTIHFLLSCYDGCFVWQISFLFVFIRIFYPFLSQRARSVFWVSCKANYVRTNIT